MRRGYEKGVMREWAGCWLGVGWVWAGCGLGVGWVWACCGLVNNKI